MAALQRWISLQAQRQGPSHAQHQAQMQGGANCSCCSNGGCRGAAGRRRRVELPRQKKTVADTRTEEEQQLEALGLAPGSVWTMLGLHGPLVNDGSIDVQAHLGGSFRTFRIIKLLGSGANGVVFEVEQLQHEAVEGAGSPRCKLKSLPLPAHAAGRCAVKLMPCRALAEAAQAHALLEEAYVEQVVQPEVKGQE